MRCPVDSAPPPCGPAPWCACTPTSTRSGSGRPNRPLASGSRLHGQPRCPWLRQRPGSTRGDARVVVHRRAPFDSDDADVVRRDGLAMLSIERCLIDKWQLRSPERRRAELITAVRGRRTSVERVRAELAGVAIPDRAELEQLLELLAAGCASELEIWGHLHVFT